MNCTNRRENEIAFKYKRVEVKSSNSLRVDIFESLKGIFEHVTALFIDILICINKINNAQ